MHLTVEPLLSPTGAGVTWEVSKEGRPVLILSCNGQRVRCELEVVEARDTCCLGIHVAMLATTALQQARSQAGLLDASGRPARLPIPGNGGP